VLPALEQRLEDIALVELGIAHYGDHPPGRGLGAGETFELDEILNQRREQRHRRSEADRTR
jgi:hypothetical protein